MLIILSYIYRLLWTTRKALYEKGIIKTGRLPRPVICVGNITTGGTGKTPTVIKIAQLLKRHYPVAILSRGYKRKSKDSVVVVSDGKRILSSPSDAGDEPYLIAKSISDVPVLVGSNRLQSGLHAMRHFNTGIFILDDGFQHIRLYRDINILLIDATHRVDRDHLLPRGTLREPLYGISRAHCAIITRADEGDKNLATKIVRTYNRGIPVFLGNYRPEGISDLSGRRWETNSLAGKDILLFSGIGNPDSFRRSVEKIGGKVKGEIKFRDHHWYNERDIERIVTEAERLSVDLIMTTEKDAVRLHREDLPFRILRVEMDVEKDFYTWLDKAVLNIHRTN